MSSLYAFLHPIKLQEEKEIVISKRFRYENGDIVPFKIRSLSQEENDTITKKSRKAIKTPTGMQEKFDALEYNKRLIVSATITPDFANKELCEHFGVLDPLLVPGKMLLPGEYTALLSAIEALSGFAENEDEKEDETVKN